jgi:hypothetical protein
MSTPEPRFPARFDPDPWDEDLARSTRAARTAAQDKPTLLFLAFGVRHYPPNSHALTVYEIAYNRLHDQELS